MDATGTQGRRHPGGRRGQHPARGGRGRSGHGPGPARRRRGRPDARDGAVGTRRHDRLHRRPADRRRPRRLLPLLLALLRLSAGRHRHAPRLRQALRHLRPQTGPGGGGCAVPPRLPAVRARLEHGRPDRLPRPAGPGRRRPPGHRADARRRPVPAQGPAQDPGQAVHGVGGVRDRGPRTGRCAGRVRRLALDLPHQPADRRPRPVADRPSPARARTRGVRHARACRLGGRPGRVRLRRRPAHRTGAGRGGVAVAVGALARPVRDWPRPCWWPWW